MGAGASSFSNADIAYSNLEQAFYKFDKNGDGTILTKDLGKNKHLSIKNF